MNAEELDYPLPPELIAQEPPEPRDSSRLLVVYRKMRQLEHTIFRNLPTYLESGDLLVANDTRVFPARLRGYKTKTRGKVEVLLLFPCGNKKWEVLVKPGRKVPPGTEVVLGNGLIKGLIGERLKGGKRELLLNFEGNFEGILRKVGDIPLPPYIYKPLLDEERYQTIYGKDLGSTAAPTAGLHFTPFLIKQLQEKGVNLAFVTLNIGLDTFRPLGNGEIADHEIHGEAFKIPLSTAKIINKTIEREGRIVAVGTSSVRVLETVAIKNSRESGVKSRECNDSKVTGRKRQTAGEKSKSGPKLSTTHYALSTKRGWMVEAKEGWTNLFIYPGYQFKIVDALITNFHMPKSSTLALVSAFGGKDLVIGAYQAAIRENYRFLSFGGAMLIL